MFNYLNRKIQRLLVSKNVWKIFYFFHFINGGFNSKKINISFKDKKQRTEIVNEIIALKKYKSYLEIGTFKDDLFSKVKCDSKTGVDPVSGGNIKKTSDDFFYNNNQKFDLIFIDGLHHYKQVKKDINNSLFALNDNGIILMHDCMPRDYYYQAVPRCQYNWNGDTWKAFIELRNAVNYDTYCCYADQGIGVILKRKNKNKLDLKIKNFKKINFNNYVENYKKYLNLIEYKDLLKIVKDYE